MARPELMRLLHACKQEPDDTATRLVLADWLEEHGDADDQERAAFIRLQVAGRFRHRQMRVWESRVPRWAPFHSVSTPVVPMHGLLSARLNPKTCAGPRAAKTARSEAWAWVESVSLKRPEAHAFASPLLDSVAAVNLESPRLTVAQLAATVRPGWRSLTLSDYRMTDPLLTLLKRASALRSFRVPRLGFQPDDIAALFDADHMPDLDELELPNIHGRMREWSAALAGSRRRLRSLSVDTGSSKTFLRAVADADSCAGLRRLRLEGMDISGAPLSSFRCLSLLESLELNRAHRHDWTGWLAACPPLSRLRRLAITGTVVGEANIPALVASPLFADLERLDLSETWVGVAGIRELTKLEASPTTLVLRRCGVPNEGLASLASWPGLASCRSLDLSWCSFGFAGLVALADSPHAAFTALDLSHCYVTDESAARLLNAPWARGLESLNLGDDACTSDLAEAVSGARLDSLRELVVGPRAATAMRLALPHVECIV